jgi:hypothetical protein
MVERFEFDSNSVTHCLFVYNFFWGGKNIIKSTQNCIPEKYLTKKVFAKKNCNKK